MRGAPGCALNFKCFSSISDDERSLVKSPSMASSVDASEPESPRPSKAELKKPDFPPPPPESESSPKQAWPEVELGETFFGALGELDNSNNEEDLGREPKIAQGIAAASETSSPANDVKAPAAERPEAEPSEAAESLGEPTIEPGLDHLFGTFELPEPSPLSASELLAAPESAGPALAPAVSFASLDDEEEGEGMRKEACAQLLRAGTLASVRTVSFVLDAGADDLEEDEPEPEDGQDQDSRGLLCSPSVLFSKAGAEAKAGVAREGPLELCPPSVLFSKVSEEAKAAVPLCSPSVLFSKVSEETEAAAPLCSPSALFIKVSERVEAEASPTLTVEGSAATLAVEAEEPLLVGAAEASEPSAAVPRGEPKADESQEGASAPLPTLAVLLGGHGTGGEVAAAPSSPKAARKALRFGFDDPENALATGERRGDAASEPAGSPKHARASSPKLGRKALRFDAPARHSIDGPIPKRRQSAPSVVSSTWSLGSSARSSAVMDRIELRLESHYSRPAVADRREAEKKRAQRERLDLQRDAAEEALGKARLEAYRLSYALQAERAEKAALAEALRARSEDAVRAEEKRRREEEARLQAQGGKNALADELRAAKAALHAERERREAAEGAAKAADAARAAAERHAGGEEAARLRAEEALRVERDAHGATRRTIDEAKHAEAQLRAAAAAGDKEAARLRAELAALRLHCGALEKRAAEEAEEKRAMAVELAGERRLSGRLDAKVSTVGDEMRRVAEIMARERRRRILTEQALQAEKLAMHRLRAECALSRYEMAKKLAGVDKAGRRPSFDPDALAKIDREIEVKKREIRLRAEEEADAAEIEAFDKAQALEDNAIAAA
eukprot:tig00000203_g17132.t1